MWEFANCLQKRRPPVTALLKISRLLEDGKSSLMALVEENAEMSWACAHWVYGIARVLIRKEGSAVEKMCPSDHAGGSLVGPFCN